MPDKTALISFVLGILITAWGFVKFAVSKSTCVAIRGDCAKLLTEKDKHVDNRLASIHETLKESDKRHDERYKRIEDFLEKIHDDFYKPRLGD